MQALQAATSIDAQEPPSSALLDTNQSNNALIVANPLVSFKGIQSQSTVVPQPSLHYKPQTDKVRTRRLNLRVPRYEIPLHSIMTGLYNA